MTNYVAEMIFEDSASEAMLALVGQEKFDWLAERVRAIDVRVNQSLIDPATMNHLDALFPIDDLENAFDYLYKYAMFGNDQELKAWVTKQKEKSHGN